MIIIKNVFGAYRNMERCLWYSWEKSENIKSYMQNNYSSETHPNEES